MCELATMGLGRCFKVTFQTRAPENFRVRQWGAERRVWLAKTQERGPPSAYAEIFLIPFNSSNQMGPDRLDEGRGRAQGQGPTKEHRN